MANLVDEFVCHPTALKETELLRTREQILEVVVAQAQRRAVWARVTSDTPLPEGTWVA